jgi:hypothetical protein
MIINPEYANSGKRRSKGRRQHAINIYFIKSSLVLTGGIEGRRTNDAPPGLSY